MGSNVAKTILSLLKLTRCIFWRAFEACHCEGKPPWKIQPATRWCQPRCPKSALRFVARRDRIFCDHCSSHPVPRPTDNPRRKNRARESARKPCSGPETLLIRLQWAKICNLIVFIFEYKIFIKRHIFKLHTLEPFMGQRSCQGVIDTLTTSKPCSV